VGMNVLECITAASCAERNWADCKNIRTKKRNRISVQSTAKLSAIHTQLVIEERQQEPWLSNLKEWSEHDKITRLDISVQASSLICVKEFKLWVEDWEKDALRVMNNANLAALVKKYKHMFFFDDDEDELRRVVEVEWHMAVKKGERAAYQLVTQLVSSENVVAELEGYVINDVFHEMVSACPAPHNNSYKLIIKN